MPKDRTIEPGSDELTTPTSDELTAPYDTGELRKLDRSQVKHVLELLASEPLHLRSDNLVPRPWGGRRLLEFKGLDGATRPGRYGESFEVAAYPVDPEAARYPSIVEFADGSSMRLSELLGRAGELVLGPAHFAAHGPNIPLLPKLLDVEGLLSVQSHPSGHPEAYVVIDCDPGATLRVGFAREVDAEAMAARLRAARELQERLPELFWVSEDRYGPMFAELLGKPDAVRRLGDRLTPLLRSADDRAELLESLAVLDACYRETLAALNTIPLRPGLVVFNAEPPGATTKDTPSAQVHCLGNPENWSILLLEIRRPGVTHRAWDHVRFPLRELAIDEAFASMTCRATRPEDFVCEPRELDGRPGVFRSVECPAFVIDHLRPRPGLAVQALAEGLPTTLHGIRGTARLSDHDDRDLGQLRAGESVLVPAGLTSLRVEAQTGEVELVQVTIPLPRQPDAEEPSVEAPLDAKQANLRCTRQIVAESLGPTEVLAIVNGGDGTELRTRLRALSRTIFRADGDAQIHVHEERSRRGQLLGLLDAVRGHRRELGGLDPDRVALGIMLPGKGTRLSPVTQRLHGIKPLFPMPIRAEGPLGPAWLDGATASLWTWALVTWTLERQGFRGVAWKWGDEAQIPARRLSTLDYDLSDVDAVRFGAAVELESIDEDLARNKEFLLADPDTGELIVSLRRRPRAELLARMDASAGERAPERFVHVGSPALSHLLLRHAEAVFGELEGWIDIDGYLFEALTHDPAQWAAERERDPQLQALLARCPDFYERAAELRRRVEADRGHAMRVVVIDFGAAPYWGDVGQLSKARAVWARLLGEGEQAEFARLLAGLAGVEADEHGNLLVGDSRIPRDGSVRGSIIIDSVIERGRIEGAVVLHSSIGAAGFEPGAVALECHVDALRLGADSLAFGSIGAYLRVPPGHAHTSIVADPRAPTPALQSWFMDMSRDPGAPQNYDSPVCGNPGSFADKFAQMRQREVEPAQIEAQLVELAARHGARHALPDIGGM